MQGYGIEEEVWSLARFWPHQIFIKIVGIGFLDILKHGGDSSHYAISDVETSAELEENLWAQD